jgi:hypothetical protein
MVKRQYFIIQYGHSKESFSQLLFSATKRSTQEFNIDLNNTIVEFVEEFLADEHEGNTLSDFFLIENALSKLNTKGYEQINPALIFSITDSRFTGNVIDGSFITLDFHLNATNNHIVQVQYFNNIAYDEIDMQLYDARERALAEIIDIAKEEVQNLNGILQDISTNDIHFNTSVKDALSSTLIAEELNKLDVYDLFVHCQYKKISDWFNDILGRETYEKLSKKLINNRADNNYIDKEALDDEIPF